MRPHFWKWFLLTYLFPLLPFVYAWDGLVSRLRSYTKVEFLRMTEKLNDNSYTWKAGWLTPPFSKFPMTYFVELPQRAS